MCARRVRGARMKGCFAMELASVADVLVCPLCRGPLRAEGGAVACEQHGAFATTPQGYVSFVREAALSAVDSTSEAYAEDQESGKRRFYDAFLKPWLDRESCGRVLEVGTGLGMEIAFLLAEHREAYGVDLPCLSPFWARRANDPLHFFHCDGAALPFPDGFFDAVFTLGVIEHIGTQVGHYTLHPDYRDARRAFARELLRVTRPNGRILVTCPNKSFPIDLAHEPTDAATPPGAMRVRRFIYDKTGMTLHAPFGTHHLLSYAEVRTLFCSEHGAQRVDPLDMRGYFAFKRFGSGPFGFLKGIAAAYINHMPRVLRESPLNPFVIAQIRK